MENVAPCPKCSGTAATAVKFTWWGGILGPKMFNVVKCSNCRTQYNGKTGKSNTTNIIIYSVVVFAIVIVIAVVLSNM